MLAYPLVSKPCSEVTDIGDILSGGSGYSNPANQWKDLRKKTGEIEVIRKLKSFRIDTKPKKIKFSAYYNNNSSQSFKKQLHRKPKPSGDSPNPSSNKQNFPPQPKHSPRRESSPYICDFSRGGLNTRLYTLVSKPCSEATNMLYLSSGVLLVGSSENQLEGFGEEDRRCRSSGK